MILPIDSDPNSTVLIVYLVIRHRKETVTLLCVNFLDATSHGINHVEIDHSTAKTLIAIMELWSLVLQRIFDGARNKTTTIAVV